ncbi:MAG: SIS domain-containing protein [Nitrospinota bacterium]
MSEFPKTYFDNLINELKSIRVSDQNGNPVETFEGIEKVAQLILTESQKGKKLIFIGNGASAGISSHMSTDYWKNGGVRAIAFNDSSLLTCISNDYGYEHVFEKPVEMFADKGDLLMAISSSGQSENILRAVKAAISAECKVITFSGFKDNNPLRQMGNYNFYSNSSSYGPVEITHLSICHCICDLIIQKKSKL